MVQASVSVRPELGCNPLIESDPPAVTHMIGLRKTLAVLALIALGGLLVTLESGAYGVNPRLVVAARVLLFPLGITIIGLLLDRYWGRWLALAAAVAVLPWALVLTFGLPAGAPLTQQSIALEATPAGCAFSP